jgi:hypothetical protein
VDWAGFLHPPFRTRLRIFFGWQKSCLDCLAHLSRPARLDPLNGALSHVPCSACTPIYFVAPETIVLDFMPIYLEPPGTPTHQLRCSRCSETSRPLSTCHLSGHAVCVPIPGITHDTSSTIVHDIVRQGCRRPPLSSVPALSLGWDQAVA